MVYTEGHGCGAAESSIVRPYEEDYEYFPVYIMGWHKIMAYYMKDSLKTNHLISVSYAGKPNWFRGDHSYDLSSVDIMSFNNYQLAIDNIEKSAEYIKHFQTDYFFSGESGKEINKPFMHSEYGTGTGVYLCDNNASFIHRVCTGSFNGLASLPLTWDSQFDEQGGWSYYQNINDLMQGIQLDNENWSAAEVMVQEDKSVEVFHLRKGETGENSKAIGVISNRTFNYYTQGELLDEYGDTTKCKSDRPVDVLHRIPMPYIYEDLNNNQLKIKNLGIDNQFRIDWYNALNGEGFGTTIFTSNLLGNGFLDFPDTLTGDESAPILFFKMYPNDDTFLSPLQSNEFESVLPLSFVKDEKISTIEMTAWTILNDSIKFHNSLNVKTSPNPTQGFINIEVNGANSNHIEWNLINENGESILQGNEISTKFLIDLSLLSNGIYFLRLTSNNNFITQEIIKI